MRSALMALAFACLGTTIACGVPAGEYTPEEARQGSNAITVVNGRAQTDLSGRAIVADYERDREGANRKYGGKVIAFIPGPFLRASAGSADAAPYADSETFDGGVIRCYITNGPSEDIPEQLPYFRSVNQEQVDTLFIYAALVVEQENRNSKVIEVMGCIPTGTRIILD